MSTNHAPQNTDKLSQQFRAVPYTVTFQITSIEHAALKRLAKQFQLKDQSYAARIMFGLALIEPELMLEKWRLIDAYLRGEGFNPVMWGHIQDMICDDIQRHQKGIVAL